MGCGSSDPPRGMSFGAGREEVGGRRDTAGGATLRAQPQSPSCTRRHDLRGGSEDPHPSGAAASSPRSGIRRVDRAVPTARSRSMLPKFAEPCAHQKFPSGRRYGHQRRMNALRARVHACAPRASSIRGVIRRNRTGSRRRLGRERQGAGFDRSRSTASPAPRAGSSPALHPSHSSRPARTGRCRTRVDAPARLPR